MPRAWKIVTYADPPSDQPRKEYFIVAGTDFRTAVSSLQERKSLGGLEFHVLGEASRDVVDWLDVQDGQIFCVAPLD
jgi:hypothetical protein